MLEHPTLKSGDRIGLICTGSICLQPDHPKIVQNFLREQYCLDAVFKNDTIQPLSAAERAEIFLSYLFDPEIKLIAAIRGGEGSADTLPYIHAHYERIKRLPPKWILGFSDITALLVYFSKHYRWPVIHGPHPLQFALKKVDQRTEQLTIKLLFGNPPTETLPTLIPLNAAAQTSQSIEAELTGGCLSLIDISIKDIWEIEPANKILFLEDINEKAHKIIRSLKYFSRIGLFESVKAILFGDFNSEPIGCEPLEQEQNRRRIIEALSQFAAQQFFPVLHTNDFGHGKVNVPLVYSCPYRLQLGKQPALSKISFAS